MPQEYSAPYLYENINDNPYAKLGFAFSYAFSFDTISDLETLPNIYDTQVFSDNLLEFILIISPEIMVGEDYGYGAYGEYNYSIDRVKEIMNDYLGIENYN